MNIGRPDVLQCDGLRAAVCLSEQIKQEKTDTNQSTGLRNWIPQLSLQNKK